MKFYFACFVLLAAFSSAKGKNTTNATVISSPSLTSLIKTSSMIVAPSPIYPNMTANASMSSPIPSNSTVNPTNMSSPAYSNSTSNVPSNRTTIVTSTPPPTTGPTSGPTSSTTSSTTSGTTSGTTSITTSSTTSGTTSGTTSSTTSSTTSGTTSGPTSHHGKDDKDYDSMKKRMWIAGAFAILFAITTVILAYLVYRQRKINRDLEDPATSRLL